jgi:hypothetical protein
MEVDCHHLIPFEANQHGRFALTEAAAAQMQVASNAMVCGPPTRLSSAEKAPPYSDGQAPSGEAEDKIIDY